MTDVIAIPRSDLPDDLFVQFHLQRIVHTRSSNEELWFFQKDRHSLLPVWHDGRLLLYPWGSQSKRNKLPLGGRCSQEDLQAGVIAWLRPEPVEILATFARSNGFWYDVPQGIRGIVLKNSQGRYHAYIITTPATHYFRTMTRSEIEPVFMGPQI